MRGNIADPTAAKPSCSVPEYGRSSVDLTYLSVGTTGKDSQENSQWHR